MSEYTYRFSCDVGSMDDYYHEFYEINDSEGNRVATAQTEKMAALIAGLLNKSEGWIAGKVRCHLCFHDWIAVYHSSSEKLECPDCGNMSDFETVES